jgi:hypothetical protein
MLRREVVESCLRRFEDGVHVTDLATFIREIDGYAEIISQQEAYDVVRRILTGSNLSGAQSHLMFHAISLCLGRIKLASEPALGIAVLNVLIVKGNWPDAAIEAAKAVIPYATGVSATALFGRLGDFQDPAAIRLQGGILRNNPQLLRPAYERGLGLIRESPQFVTLAALRLLRRVFSLDCRGFLQHEFWSESWCRSWIMHGLESADNELVISCTRIVRLGLEHVSLISIIRTAGLASRLMTPVPGCWRVENAVARALATGVCASPLVAKMILDDHDFLHAIWPTELTAVAPLELAATLRRRITLEPELARRGPPDLPALFLSISEWLEDHRCDRMMKRTAKPERASSGLVGIESWSLV